MKTPSDSPYRLEVCRDGSHTVWSDLFGQFYHNPNGAVAESNYVFLHMGKLQDKLTQHTDLTIIEIGFGTGLNLLLCVDLIEIVNFKGQLHYYSVEAWPIKPTDAERLNYNRFLRHPELAPSLTHIFSAIQPGWNHLQVHPHVQLHLFVGTFQTMRYPETLHADVVFFDAFSPSANPDLWKIEVFKTLHDYANNDALLVTYCASSEARAAMAIAGWYIARAPGALGKREMTVASPNKNTLSHLNKVNTSRLLVRFQNGEFQNLQ